MIGAAHLTQFFIASILIIMVPGPSVLFTLARGVAWGRTVAVLTVLGNSLGTLLLSLIVALGLGPLLSHSRAFSVILQLCGGCYLLFLGFDALRHRREHAHAMAQREASRPSPRRIVQQGFMVGVLNPKSLVFFAAVFPHFVDRASGRITEQLIVFGVIFSVMAFCSDGTWGIIAGTAREWLSGSPTRLVVLRSVGGCVMCTLGVLIVVTALTS
ncbi:MAG: LysE family translocator [Actinomycetota bacterium]|jgi:threonine/homoserine/homoserine lactone efflux protein|nr:LysE family translocator [Actinomycetota bacterium]